MQRNGATGLWLVGLCLGLPWSVTNAQETRRSVITPENASRLHVVHRIPHDAYRIVNGPSLSQCTIHGFNE